MDNKRTLYNGVRARVAKYFTAGTIHVSRVEIMGETLINTLSGGQPYEYAYN